MKTEMNIYSYCVSNAGTSSAEVGRLGKFHKTLKKNELEHFLLWWRGMGLSIKILWRRQWRIPRVLFVSLSLFWEQQK